MLGKTIVALMLLLVPAAFSIIVLSPDVGNIKDGDSVELGTIGPGQTVSIEIRPEVTKGGIHGIGGLYDIATVRGLPEGWSSTSSKLYQNPLQLTITADPQAPEGDYSARIVVVDEGNGEQLGNVTFIVKMHITYDVMDCAITPSYKNVGPGQPARFAITITNKGSTGDVFDVSAIGPKRWDFRKQVYVPAHTSHTVYYEIVGNEEETYRTTIKVRSMASSIIAEEQNVTLFVRSDVFGDYKATNDGVPVFPIFETLVYSLAGLISNTFG